MLPSRQQRNNRPSPKSGIEDPPLKDLEYQETPRRSVPTTKPTSDATLLLLILSWYISSIICTNTSKSLQLPWRTLTLCQMLLSSMCGIIGILVFRLDGKGSLKLFPSRDAAPLTIALSLAFSAGFVTLNASLTMTHVSTVMTLRAAEPVATWMLGLCLLPEETTTFTQVLTLIIIVVGAAISATSSTASDTEHNNSMTGFLLVMLCNGCFAMRNILTKRLKVKNASLDNYTLFLQLCVLASIWQAILWLSVGGEKELGTINLPIMIVNGITFYLYLQLSWSVLGRIGAVTHSVCNSLRRPAICASGWLFFGGATPEGVAGVVLATVGTMLYSRAKRQAALGSRTRTPITSTPITQSYTAAIREM